MREHNLYGPIIQRARAEDFLLYRLRDQTTEGKNPFDIGGTTSCGKAVAMEVKVLDGRFVSDNISISWSIFEIHQRTWLKAFCDKGALALIALYFQTDDLLMVLRLEPFDFDGERLSPVRRHKRIIRNNFSIKQVPSQPLGLKVLV